jgi:hypothetical protein
MTKSFLALFLACMFGCASVVGKANQNVAINSNPAGVNITITNSSGQPVFTGVTPAVVQLRPGAGFFKVEQYTVVFQGDGIAPVSTPITYRLGGWYLLGNVFIGFVVGWFIIDPLTGAMWKLEDVNANLTPGVVNNAEPGINIVSLDSVPAEVRAKMVRVR